MRWNYPSGGIMPSPSSTVPGAQTACEDLARAISFIFEHAEELEVDTDCYSLWGGSAGGRMAAWLGSYGPAAFGGDELATDLGPSSCSIPATAITQKTPRPPFACVGESDGIANWRTMQRRLDAHGAPWGSPPNFTTIQACPTASGWEPARWAEGWLEEAVAFWEGANVSIPVDR